ncbi:osmotically inducible protein C [Bosea sp. Tri-44]|uniref:bifunctional alpha/beta hydrolase/OsmC family protein n=1 Tax=Bosea sp. Tri-44 TaxID=1972137 RepID=UPI00100DDCD3|nr:bifunctional alpha/beta hydrolase/OsmC family protein [Bosea sp. Tri-44]RXT51190.1 osmotically inducible protein C [Bosea sp. Tri-44]
MRTEKVSFRSSGGIGLAGVLDLPARTPRAYALFAHCFSCSSQSHAARRISEALALRGIGTLRFDFTGLGASGGKFADSHFAANIDDLKAAARYMSERRSSPALLIGHSLGGAAVIAAAGCIFGARAVVTIGAPFDPAHALRHFGPGLDEIERSGEAKVTIGGRSVVIGRDFIAASRGQDQLKRLADLKRALLVLHSPTDDVVGIDHARDIFDAARHPKSFIALDGADHFLADRSYADQVAGMITAWADRYIDRRDEPDADPQVEGTVKVRSTEGKFLQEITAGPHQFASDEPVGAGGVNAGPTPYDLLLASLGACTSMTLRLFAGREGIPLEGVSIGLSHDRIHHDDCAAGEGRMERITRRIAFHGTLSDEQRALLLKVADRCPVHRTLVRHVDMVTTEAVTSGAT